MKKTFKRVATFLSMAILAGLIFQTSFVKAAAVSPSKLLVGYWHNFDNGTGIINLRDVSSKWDVINVSFGETGADRSTIVFSPCYGTEASFKSDIDYLHSLGKKVVLSIGGQNGVLLLPDATAKQNFISSVEALIDKYGFDGIDIDLESGMNLNGGDTDFKNPTTPQITNLISSLHTLAAHYGSNFILSMAPETAYVQGGFTAYGGIWGAYRPLIYGTRDILTYIHVQHYNAGSGMGMDGISYAQGTADFEVAMADMLLHGFPIAGNSNNLFPALREDQVMIGLPACPSAAPSGGYITPTEMKKALDYIIKGISFGGKYKLANQNGYPGFKGLMSWSVNWDAKSNYEFTTNYRAYFDGLTPPSNSLQAATLTSSVVNNGAYTLTATIPAYNTATSYKIMEGTAQISTGTLVSGQASPKIINYNVTGKVPGTYDYTVVVTDGVNSLVSSKVSVTVPVPVQNTLHAATLSSSTVNNGAYTLTATIPANNTATSYKIMEGTTQISTGTLVAGQGTTQTITYNISGKAAGIYNYTVVVSDGTNSLTSNQISVTVQQQSGAQPWSSNSVAYKVGDLVTYNGHTYKCIYAHTSNVAWTPDICFTLWTLVS